MQALTNELTSYERILEKKLYQEQKHEFQELKRHAKRLDVIEKEMGIINKYHREHVLYSHQKE